ncbi:MAG: tRNA glutamyl-Q(34) synthetase GluQRS [Oscillospiraceae bacterium]|nr:tRNA glutamyl-Q(34) synthetase GluQRS [Oscillospiraceae bacterium]
MMVGRFAPSPSGRMHLGNVFSALLAWLSVRSQGGKMILRIEDLDPERSKPEYIDLLRDDLSWLGLDWDEEMPPQSTRSSLYESYFETLPVYPCYCTRNELHSASAPHSSDGSFLYPGICRNLTAEERALKTRKPSWRVQVPEREIAFTDGIYGPVRQRLDQCCGDFILRRSDGVYAYQLAVVCDDGLGGVTQVVRGRDLLDSTPRQIWLYEQFGFPVPEFYHVPLLVAPDGRRLSKRERDLDLGHLQQHFSSQELLGILAYSAGLIPECTAMSPKELIPVFSWDKIKAKDISILEYLPGYV